MHHKVAKGRLDRRKIVNSYAENRVNSRVLEHEEGNAHEEKTPQCRAAVAHGGRNAERQAAQRGGHHERVQGLALVFDKRHVGYHSQHDRAGAHPACHSSPRQSFATGEEHVAVAEVRERIRDHF